MTETLSVGGKTFLLGEYAVLHEGPALLLATAPRFALKGKKESQTATDLFSQIAPESPAGKLIAKDLPFYQQFTFEFVDPYQGLGGLGASSAQFALFYAFKEQITHFLPSHLQACLSEYRELAHAEKGFTPSGADIISQLQGGLCFFYQKNKLIVQLAWPFPTLYFCLIHTGNKMATHTHLSTLTHLPANTLENLVFQAKAALSQGLAAPFIQAVGEYGLALDAMGLVAPETQHLLHHIKKIPGVLAAKGCGAMGADVLLCLLEKNKTKPLEAWCDARQLKRLFLGNKATGGLEWSSHEE
ncbi:MAG: hypothetical protein WC785_03295 [Tatlockia sp.]